MYVCMYVCMYVYIYIYIYLYTRITQQKRVAEDKPLEEMPADCDPMFCRGLDSAAASIYYSILSTTIYHNIA